MLVVHYCEGSWFGKGVCVVLLYNAITINAYIIRQLNNSLS